MTTTLTTTELGATMPFENTKDPIVSEGKIMTSAKRKKPKKPYPSFPLTAHNNGQWCKKIRGTVHFFGIWKDPHAALDNYLSVAADLHAGREPRVSLSPAGLTVKDACNHFLTYQLGKVEAGEISARWFEDCRRVLDNFARCFGRQRLVSDLVPDDFVRYRQRLVSKGLIGSSGLGVCALNRTMTVVKGMFKHAHEMDLIDRPVKYGKAFNKPSATLRRKMRRAGELANGKRLFAPAEVRSLIEASPMPLRAMILLGINGGFGNTDCARLPIQAVDFGRAVIEFDRPKTAIERVVPLWPETVEALRQSLAKRPKPADQRSGKLVFLTTFGQPWGRDRIHRTEDGEIEKVVAVDAVGQEFHKLLRKLRLKRRGLGFYTLRHTFRTWADGVRDQHAIFRIMGHQIPGMSGIYVEAIELDRLRAVVNHVHRKLFEEGPPGRQDPATGQAT